jgi:hypothetical protein
VIVDLQFFFSPFSYVNIIPTTRILLLLLSEIETDLIYIYLFNSCLSFFPKLSEHEI